MEIRKIDSNKLDYKDLLLEADPEIEVVKEYIDKGDMYVLFDNEIPVAEILITKVNDEECELFATVERQFLNTLERGCTAPIGALVEKKDKDLYTFKGAVLSIDGQEMLTVESEFFKSEYLNKGKDFANELIAKGAAEMITKIKQEIGQR